MIRKSASGGGDVFDFVFKYTFLGKFLSKTNTKGFEIIKFHLESNQGLGEVLPAVL